MPISCLCLQQFFSQLFIKEVVATTFFLWLKYELVRIDQCTLNDFVYLCSLLTEILKRPNALEQSFDIVCDLLAT